MAIVPLDGGAALAIVLTMRRVSSQAAIVVVAAVAAVVSGCAAAPVAPRASSVDAHVRPGLSMVFDAPKLARRQRQLAERDPEAAATLPWYAARNDYQPTTYAGYRQLRSEVTIDRTYDRQRHTPGRVFDYYWSRTATRRVLRTTY